MKKFIPFLSLLYITACSSLKGSLPPDENFIRQMKTNVQKEDVSKNQKEFSRKQSVTYLWILAQKKAIDLPLEAALIYKDLASLEDFPLKDLARIRGDILSLETPKDAELFWQKNPPENSWTKKDYLDFSYLKAKSLKMTSRILFFAKSLQPYKPRTEDKVNLYKEVLTFAKENNDSETQKQTLEILTRLAPSEFKEKTSDPLDVAFDFEKNRSFNDARKIYEKILKDKNAVFKDKLQAFERIRQTYRIERNDDMFMKKTDEMISYFKKRMKNVPESEDYFNAFIDATIKKARSQWNKHETESAQKTLSELLSYKEIPPEQLGSIYYLLAQMNKELKKPDEAQKLLLVAQDLPLKDRTLLDKILWTRAWINYTLFKNYPLSQELFLKLTMETKNRLLYLQSSYWYAQAKLKTQKDEGENLLKKLGQEDPFGYYGILAQKDLKISFAPLKKKNYKGAFFDTFEWLHAFGEDDLAWSFLKEKSKKAKEDSDWEELLALYQRIGKFAHALDILNRFENPKRNEFLADFPSLFFPTPYEEIVKKNHDETLVSEELIYSIMRQESSFNPEVRSPSDAFGLMQIIPETAKQMSREYKKSYSSPTDLYSPYINVALGTSYLKKLKNRYDNLPMTIAAYNAGEKAVDSWQGYLSDDMTIFVENIPYAETQTYVKLVYRNLIVYKRLNSKEDIELQENPFKITY